MEDIDSSSCNENLLYDISDLEEHPDEEASEESFGALNDENMVGEST